jgi:hypothetical protein
MAAVEVRSNRVSLLFLVIAIVLFIVSALGVGQKLGFDLVDLGLAAFAASFIF